MSDELADAVRRAYEINRNVVSIDPEFIANGAMEIIRFPQSLHPTGWAGCNLYCRQLARSYLRRNCDPEEKARNYVSGQGSLALDALQDRYPRLRQPGQDPEYVLREHLTEDDRWFNVYRMRKASEALQRHSDALEIETRRLFGPPKPPAAEDRTA